MSAAPEALKACCAAVYSSEAARWLLGDSFHPGGVALSRELLDSLDARPGHRLLDVASGPGTTALGVASASGADVVGVDLSAANVATARAAAAQAGLADRVDFVEGDAERLPFEDASFDGALCECAFCLFPDKAGAASEIARVLRPGGRLALSDVTANPERLSDELRTVSAWAACVADARPLEEVVETLAAAGLAVERAEARDDAVAELVERIEARLHLAHVLTDSLPGVSDRVGEWLPLAREARRAVEEGALGYAIVVARRE
jgi:arsenite methyltransferase